MLHDIKISGTTDGSGDATETGEAVFGYLHALRVEGASLDAGADTTISYTDRNGDTVALLTLTDTKTDTTYYPRPATCDGTGSALTDYARPEVAGPVKVVVAQGGDTKAFSVTFFVDS